MRAQEVGGALEGRVVDATGAARPQALVTVEGPALLGPRAARTDERGRFRFAALPVGRCTLALALLGYRPLREDVAIELGRTSDLGDLTLQTEAIPIAGTTVIASKRPRLDPSSTWIGGRLDVGAMRALPVDRDYQSVVTLLPHANESYAGDRANLLGTTGAETKYYVDGVNTVEPPGNALSTSVPYNFLQEVEVRAGGYEAEFGGAGGGIVNAVTVTGGNQFHAQVFGFYGSRLLTSTSGVLAVSEKTSTFASWDAGLTLGGPVRRDRLWYSLAYNPAGERERIRLAGTPALDDRRLAHRFAGKLNWRADDRTSVSLAVLGDPGDREQVGGVILSKLVTIGNLDPVLGDQRGGGANVSLQATRLLGASAFLDARITRSDSRYSLVPRTARGRSEPLYLDARTGFVEGGMGNVVERYGGRTTAHAQLAVTRSGHLMKGGIEYEDEFFGEDWDLDQITRLQDSLYQVVTLRNRHSQNHLRVPTAYLQDTWQAAGGLRLRLGLRWAGEYWMTSGGDVGQRILDGWQPRAGFVWQPRLEGNLKLFGSGGRFVQQTRLNVPQFFQQDVPSLYLVQLFDHDPRVDPSGGSTAFAQVLGRQAEVDRLHGATFDEYQLGGEWLAVGGWAAGLRGVIRTQRSAIVGVLSPLTGQAVYGNPGRGELAAYPEVAREYQALELTLSHADTSGVARLGYVLSRNRGNYEGYWDQTAAQNDPLGGAAFAPSFSTSANASGFLPDDRTHVLKLQLSRSLGRTFEAGATLVWESGTPLGELGATPFGAPYYVFLSPRGSQGRSPALYDLNLRLAHEARWLAVGRGAPRLMLDVYHLGNPRKPVAVDQVHYRGFQSGQQVGPNPSYQHALLSQPPVAYRFGCELRW